MIPWVSYDDKLALPLPVWLSIDSRPVSNRQPPLSRLSVIHDLNKWDEVDQIEKEFHFILL